MSYIDQTQLEVVIFKDDKIFLKLMKKNSTNHRSCFKTWKKQGYEVNPSFICIWISNK